MTVRFVFLAVLCFGLPCSAQEASSLDRILNRLDAMEQQNRKLMDEVHALREELAALKEPSVEERLSVQEARTEEMAQTKVETSQKSPVSLTGMLLFNAFHNGTHAGSGEYPASASQAAAMSPSGASLRQTVLGLTFNGPSLPWGGKATGSLYMDFFAGSQDPANNLLHIRVATLDLNWRNTTITVGQDKPIISPREPDSLAQVGISPLTNAGNLWDWQPQVRVEQRFGFGENSGLRAQAGVYQTEELDSNVPAQYANTLEHSRPGYEGRLAFWHKNGARRFEFAPGYHASTTHVAGTSVDSRIFSFDGLVKPAKFLEFTGAFFNGQNVSSLGALRQGFVIVAPDLARPIHSIGGWGQLALFATDKLTFHAYGGQHWNRPSDLLPGTAQRNFVYAGNFIYRIAPNILGSFEVSQTRTSYLNQSIRLNNHYDMALAYLF